MGEARPEIGTVFVNPRGRVYEVIGWMLDPKSIVVRGTEGACDTAIWALMVPENGWSRRESLQVLKAGDPPWKGLLDALVKGYGGKPGVFSTFNPDIARFDFDRLARQAFEAGRASASGPLVPHIHAETCPYVSAANGGKGEDWCNCHVSHSDNPPAPVDIIGQGVPQHTCINTCTTIDGRSPPPCPACAANFSVMGGMFPAPAEQTAAGALIDAARAVAHEVDTMFAGGGDGGLEKCHECDLGPIGSLRDAMHKLRPLLAALPKGGT